MNRLFFGSFVIGGMLFLAHTAPAGSEAADPRRLVVVTVTVEVPPGLASPKDGRISFYHPAAYGWGPETFLLAGSFSNNKFDQTWAGDLKAGSFTLRFLAPGAWEPDSLKYFYYDGSDYYEFDLPDSGVGKASAKGIRLAVTRRPLDESHVLVLGLAPDRLKDSQPRDWIDSFLFVEASERGHSLVAHMDGKEESLVRVSLSNEPPLYLVRRNQFLPPGRRRLLEVNEKGQLVGMADPDSFTNRARMDTLIHVARSTEAHPIAISSDFLTEAEQVDSVQSGVWSVLGRALDIGDKDHPEVRLPRWISASSVRFQPQTGSMAARLSLTLKDRGGVGLDLSLNRPTLTMLIPGIEPGSPPIELDFANPSDLQELDRFAVESGGSNSIKREAIDAIRHGRTGLKVSLRDFHPGEATLTFQPAGWKINFTKAVDKRAEFVFASPDPDDRFEVNPAGWVVGSANDPRAIKPITLDVNGRLVFRQIRKLAGESNLTLTPVGDELWLEPLALPVQTSDLDGVSTRTYTLHPKPRMVEIRPSSINHFAPGFSIEMRDGGEIEVFGHRAEIKLTRGSETALLASKTIPVRDIVAITPIHLYSFVRTEVQSVKLGPLIACFDSTSPDWSTFFDPGPGLDVYTDDPKTPVIIRGPSGIEFLMKDSDSPQFKSRASFGHEADAFDWWDGSAWVKIDTRRPGRHRLNSSRSIAPTTVYIVISARVLDGMVSSGESKREPMPAEPIPPGDSPPNRISPKKSDATRTVSDVVLADILGGDAKEPVKEAGRTPERMPEPAQQELTNDATPLTQVKMFVSRWSRLTHLLRDELERRGYKRVIVFVVYPNRNTFKLESVADIDLASPSAFEALGSGVGKQIESMAYQFARSNQLSSDPQTIPEMLRRRPPDQYRPGNLLLLVIPEGRVGRSLDLRVNSFFQVEQIRGFNQGTFSDVKELFATKK